MLQLQKSPSWIMWFWTTKRELVFCQQPSNPMKKGTIDQLTSNTFQTLLCSPLKLLPVVHHVHLQLHQHQVIHIQQHVQRKGEASHVLHLPMPVVIQLHVHLFLLHLLKHVISAAFTTTTAKLPALIFQAHPKTVTMTKGVSLMTLSKRLIQSWQRLVVI